MTQAQQRRIEEYETAAVESDMLAQLANDQSKRAMYVHLAGHFRDLVRDFRDTLDIGYGR